MENMAPLLFSPSPSIVRILCLSLFILLCHLTILFSALPLCFLLSFYSCRLFTCHAFFFLLLIFVAICDALSSVFLPQCLYLSIFALQVPYSVAFVSFISSYHWTFDVKLTLSFKSVGSVRHLNFTERSLIFSPRLYLFN